MIRSPILGQALLLALLATLTNPGPGQSQSPVRAGAVTDHLIVISIDGLRPDALERFAPPTLLRLQRQGSYSLDAQTILPSKTLPSHTSMLTGEPPEEHGVEWNSLEEDRGVVETPTIFQIARNHGFHTAAFFSKSKLAHLVQEGAFDHARAPRRNVMADETAAATVRYLRHRQPNLTFVHLGETDYAGHAFGWMGRAYGWAVGRVDGAVEGILAQADETFGPGNYTVIVTSDHGGHDRDHGTEDPLDTTIPWIAWGEGVRGGEIAADVMTFDTAATALWLLGVPLPDDLSGRPVVGAFTDAASLTAAMAQEGVGAGDRGNEDPGDEPSPAGARGGAVPAY